MNAKIQNVKFTILLTTQPHLQPHPTLGVYMYMNFGE